MPNMNSVAISEEQMPCDLTGDRISSLPWDVLSIIFSFLPILDAVRTSALAKDWRYRWLSLSEFALDSDIISVKSIDDTQRWELICNIINKYLSHHTSTITQFYLRMNINPCFRDLRHWIGYLSTQDVEVLNLQICMEWFLVPSSLFSFKKLKKLFLRGCALFTPPDFEGFNSLHSLYLRDSIFSSDKLNHLISSCPNLEKLTLLNIFGLTLLRIRSLRLTELFVDTGVEDIAIEVASCLSTVIITNVKNAVKRVTFNSHGVTRSLLGLDTIKELGISGVMVKHLAVDYGVGDFPWKNSTLTSLEFRCMNFDTVEVFHVCLSLLSSCPNVHRLYFTLSSAKGPKLITKFLKENRGRFSFPRLISLEMMCPEGVGMGCTVNFLEFIGAHSPNIKSLTVVNEGRDAMNRTRVLQMLRRLRKPCPQACVRYVHDDPHTGHLRLTYQ